MTSKKTSRRSPKKFVKVPTDCGFCNNKVEPDYKDYQALQKYLTDRAKIMEKKRTGICSKHQKRISVAIKRARHLGLLPFTPHL